MEGLGRLRELFKIYEGKKVLLTGMTGFKGSWLGLWLKKLKVSSLLGYSLKMSNLNMFDELGLNNDMDCTIGDILDYEKLYKTVKSFNPDIIFHLAAQPLVRRSYSEPILTYHTNVMGTLNLLDIALKTVSVKAFVNVTTDKCYENREVNRGYREEDAFGGYDMYSSSKACSEILSSSFRRSFLNGSGFLLSTARAGNVIGGGDWAQDRLIPDCVRAINSNGIVKIRNPKSVRPWQHVLEPLSGYLMLGAQLLEGKREFCEGFNFGPNEDSVVTVESVVNKFIDCYGKGRIEISENSELHEANLLMLNIDKAKNVLNWYPKYSVDIAIERTALWYSKFYERKEDMKSITIDQIEEYEDFIDNGKTVTK